MSFSSSTDKPAIGNPVEILYRIARNVSLFSGAELFSQLIGCLTGIYAARALGPTGFGDFAFALTLVMFTAGLGDFGLSTLLIKRISQRRQRLSQNVIEILLLRTALTAFCLGISLTYLHLIRPDPEIRRFMAIAGGSLLLTSYSVVLSSALRATNQFHLDSFLKIVVRCCYAACFFIALKWRPSLVGLASAIGIAAAFELFIALMVNARICLLSLNTRFAVSWSKYLLILRNAIPYGVLSVLVMIYFRIDTLMLERMRGPAEVGCYNAAYRILEGILLFPWALSTVLFPVFSDQLKVGENNQAQKVTRTLLKYLTYLGILLATLTTFWADKIISSLYATSGYSSAAAALKILAWAIVAVFISATTSSLISAGKHPQINTWIAGIMVLENIGLNLVLIPRWGLVGAATATVLTEFSGIFMNTFYIRKYLFDIVYAQNVVDASLAAIAMGLLIFLLKTPGWLPFYLGIYTLVLLVIGGISGEEMRQWGAIALRTEALEK